MSACTFFGHRECPDCIAEELYKEIENLIRNNNVTTFYIGTQGNFDTLAYKNLKILRNKYPHIQVYRVLAYMPKSNHIISDSILPEGIELVNPKYAISWRNKWMLNHSEYVIYYVTHKFGCSSKFVEIARKNLKILISIS